MSEQPKLKIDLSNRFEPQILYGDVRLTDQWTEFYAQLALMKTDVATSDQYLSPEALHDLAIWSEKRIDSVGKEVSRHIKQLTGTGLEHLLEYKYKTKYWRLSLPPDAITFIPDRRHAVQWIEARTRTLPTSEVWLEQLDKLVEAHILLRGGEGEQACLLLRGVKSFATMDIEAWATLLDARGTDMWVSQSENLYVLDSIAEAWESRIDPAGRSVAARIRARAAMRKRFSQPESEYLALTRLAGLLERAGDVAALAAVINVTGVLANRLDRPREAAKHHLRAASLFGIVGDNNSLQSALFNLANSYARALRKEKKRMEETVLKILDMSIRICDEFSVGPDTVQSEVSGCHWCIDMFDYERARGYLDRAAKIIMKIDSSYEQGCYLLARARLDILSGAAGGDALQDLRTAKRAFLEVGDDDTVESIDAIMQLAEMTGYGKKG